LTNSMTPVEILADTFTPPEIESMKFYDLMATPLISPGQTVNAVLYADSANNEPISISLRLKHYNAGDSLSTLDGPSVKVLPGQDQVLTWTIPDVLDSQPIQKVGIAVSCQGGCAMGQVWLDSLSYAGTPCVTLKRPTTAQSHPFGPVVPGQPCTFWRRAWIHNLSTFATVLPGMSFCLAQDQGEALCVTGTREWFNYKVTVPKFRIDLGSGGLAVRVQGLNRYYALVWNKDRKSVALIKARDEERKELAIVGLEWNLDQSHNVTLCAEGDQITAYIASEKVAEVKDGEYASGGIGVVVLDGSVAIDKFEIGSCH